MLSTKILLEGTDDLRSQQALSGAPIRKSRKSQPPIARQAYAEASLEIL
ncbi:MAG: hypothetical protein ABIS13_08005 [Nitrosospira sp.]